MKDQLVEVKELMLSGIITTELRHGFNGFQEKEEIEKQGRKKQMTSTELERMFKYEDHPLIYGYVSGLGYENLYLTDTFYTVFGNSNNYKNIHQALISIGDYRQCDDNRNRYYMANSNRSTWTQLLHKSRNRVNFEQSMSIVIKLLECVRNGVTIESIRDSFIDEREKQHKYTWRYYFAKYPDMLRGADGELTWDASNYYICTTLNKHQFNGQHWNPFLNVIHKILVEKLASEKIDVVLNLDNYGGNLSLSHPISSIASAGDGFEYFYQENHEHWHIVQDESGIDTEDRVIWAVNKIESIIRLSFKEQSVS